MVEGSGRGESISVFLGKDIREFFVSFGEFSFGLFGLLGDVGGNGHFPDSQGYGEMSDVTEMKLF